MSASVSLPVVTGGVGAAISTAGLSSPKTLIATGVDGTITIEASGDGVNFIPVTTFSLGGTEQIISLVCAAMRVNAANGSANSVSVMAEPTTVKVGIIPAPPTNGPGVALDVSAFGFLTSVLVTQPSGGGTLEIQISQDGIGWTTAYESVSYATVLDAPKLSGNFIRAVGNQATSASIVVCGEAPRIPIVPVGPDGVVNTTIVLRPGATGADAPGGNVVTTWEEAYALIEKFRHHGRIYLYIDTLLAGNDLVYDPGGPSEDHLGGYIEIPPGTWDMLNVWVCSTYDSNGGRKNVTWADNSFWINLMHVEGQQLVLANKSTVSSPIVQINTDFMASGVRQEMYCLTAACKPLIKGGPGSYSGLFNTSSNTFFALLGKADANPQCIAPVYDIAGGDGYVEFCGRGTAPGSIMNSAAPSGSMFWGAVYAEGNSSFDSPALGATPQFFAHFGGQIAELVDSTSGPAYTAELGRMILADTSANPVVITIAPAGAMPGETIAVKRTGANLVTVVPPGADTIEDGSIGVDLEVKKWMNDGAGRWVKIQG